MPLGTPVLAGQLASTTTSASYQVPVAQPVPPGAAVAVFAGSPGTTCTSVTDSQGNAYALAASSTAGEWLQAFTAVNAAGLNPAAGDFWTVTWAASNSSQKTVLAVAVAGAGIRDAGTAANGSSAAPSVSATAQSGNEVVLGCVQDANAGGAPSSLTLTPLGSLSPSGQQFMAAAYGWAGNAGAVSLAGSIASAAWAVVLVTFTAAAPQALGPQQAPSGGAVMPPYPVLPAPRTWSAKDPLLVPWLRGDPGNAVLLAENPPLLVAVQSLSVQSLPPSAVTPLQHDTEFLDTWQAHQQPSPNMTAPLPGWYLAESLVRVAATAAGSTCASGLQAVQGGTAYQTLGGQQGAATVAPVVTACDLFQLAVGDTIASTGYQDSGAAVSCDLAWLKTEWVAAASGTAVSPPVPAAGWTSGATVLLQSLSVGATSAVVADPSGIVAGGVIQVGTGSAAAENVTVTAVTGQAIGITATAYPHPAQSAVAVPVSAAFMNQQVRDKARFLAYRPVARLANNAVSQSLPSQAFPAGTAVTFANPATAAKCVDNFGGWAAGQPTRYTFPVSGTWRLYGQVYATDLATPVTLSAGLQVSGGTVQWGGRCQSAGSSTSVCVTVRKVIRARAGDWVQLAGSQASGSSMTLQNGTGNRLCKLVAVWRGL